MYYFAYGSNIDLYHFTKYISKEQIKIIGPAYLPNYILKYRKISVSKKKSGVANIEKRANSRTYGIIYYIKDIENVSFLDKKEGFKNNENNVYNKLIHNVILIKNNEKVNCFMYQINDKYKLGEIIPSKKYLQHLINGNKKFNLPHSHLKRIFYIFA